MIPQIDWQLIGISFITVFLAEIGDKSQLVAIALGGSSNNPRAVFIGSTVALILASLLGVLASGAVAQFLPEKLLKSFAAIGFATMALRILWVGGEPNYDKASSDKFSSS